MLMQYKILILATLMALLSSGCAVVDQPQNDSRSPATTSDAAVTPAEQLAAMNDIKKTDIDWLLRYYRLLSTVPSKVLSDEYERTKKEFSAKRSEKNQWQLATLLSIPSAPFYDSGRSSELFKELTNSELERDPLLKDAAFLMHLLLNEQHLISKKSDFLADQLAESQSANRTLQDQVNALKAIENTLYQRNKAEGKSKP